MVGKDCQAEAEQRQQPDNICLEQASEQADKDNAIFYNNLQIANLLRSIPASARRE
jgi:hypothetical protein